MSEFFVAGRTTRKSTLNWIRQPTISDDQRQLWKKALQLLLNTHSRLVKPLGTWHSEPNQQWTHYYNESTGSLLSNIYSAHPGEQFRTYPHGNDTSPTDHFFDNDTHPLDGNVPHFTLLVPVDATSDKHYSRISFKYRRQTKNRRLSANPQTAYIQGLPKSRQRLLQVGRIRRTRTKNEFYALLMHTLLTGGNLNCGTDGGLRINKGTFGLVISVEDKIIWEGCGPVDGNPETASSKRSELFGYAGLLEVLLLMDTLMLPPKDTYPTTQVNTFIDNISVVTQLQAFLLGYRPKRAYPHDADIISHIRWLWTQLPRFNHEVSWVKAHQDDKINFNLLPLQAQLIVSADALATEYEMNAKHPSDTPRSQPAFFSSANVCLSINTQRITSQYSESIRFHINGTKHRAHLQKTRPNWKSDAVWNNLDMQGLGISFKSLDTPLQHFTTKMLHGWLNTGHQREKLTKDSLCPCCQAPDETFEHILRCKSEASETARKAALQTISKLDKRGSTTWRVLHQGIKNWLQDGE